MYVLYVLSSSNNVEGFSISYHVQREPDQQLALEIWDGGVQEGIVILNTP